MAVFNINNLGNHVLAGQYPAMIEQLSQYASEPLQIIGKPNSFKMRFASDVDAGMENGLRFAGDELKFISGCDGCRSMISTRTTYAWNDGSPFQGSVYDRCQDMFDILISQNPIPETLHLNVQVFVIVNARLDGKCTSYLDSCIEGAAIGYPLP